MRALLDVSALVALLDEDHLHHAVVRSWLRANIAAGWATCSLTQSGAVRILSQPAYPNPLSVVAAGTAVRAAVASAHHEQWSDDVSILDPALVDLGRVLGARQVPDVHLLALAVRRGGCLVTLDRRISCSAVHDAEPHRLVSLVA